ncbi:MAG: hypothetical protein NXI22_26270, partial [bacterium]|nr:hypothetical protein [bacterium]
MDYADNVNQQFFAIVVSPIAPMRLLCALDFGGLSAIFERNALTKLAMEGRAMVDLFRQVAYTALLGCTLTVGVDEAL